MRRIVEGLAGLAGFAVILVLIILVNGGFVWRKDCVTERGAIETSWTYRPWQFIPYLAPSESGCRAYSGTRWIVSSTIGVWSIPETSVGAVARDFAEDTSDEEDAYYAELYAIGADVQAGSRPDTTPEEYQQVLADALAKLESLTVPARFADDHAEFVDAYRESNLHLERAFEFSNAGQQAAQQELQLAAEAGERIRLIGERIERKLEG